MDYKNHKNLNDIFPITVCGKEFDSFRAVDRAFGFNYGTTCRRFVKHGIRGDKLALKIKSCAHLFPMTVCGRSFGGFAEIDKAFGLAKRTSYSRYFNYGMRGDDLAKPPRRSCDIKSIFPMTVCNRIFKSFRGIDAAFHLPIGTAHRRYVRDGLRGDDLARKSKPHNDVLNRTVTIRTEKKTVREWIEKNGISTKLFYHRFYEMGWQLKDCVTVAVGITTGRNHTTGRYVTWHGKSYRMIDFARLCGLSLSAVLHRMNSGWTAQQIHDRPADCSKHYVKRSDFGKNRSVLHIEADAHGIPYNTVISRMRSGWSKEDALSRGRHDKTVDMRNRRRKQLAYLGIAI